MAKMALANTTRPTSPQRNVNRITVGTPLERVVSESHQIIVALAEVFVARNDGATGVRLCEGWWQSLQSNASSQSQNAAARGSG